MTTPPINPAVRLEAAVNEAIALLRQCFHWRARDAMRILENEVERYQATKKPSPK